MSDAPVRKSVPTSVRHCLDDPYHLRFVRITWVDYINFVRYRIVPLHKFKKFIEHHDSSPAKPVTSFEEDGYKVITNMKGGVSLTKATLGLIFIALAEGFGPTGEFLYVPDPNSAARLKYADDQISIMGWFEEKECDYQRFKQVSGKGVEGERSRLFRSPLCPRGTLERVLLSVTFHPSLYSRLNRNDRVVTLRDKVSPSSSALRAKSYSYPLSTQSRQSMTIRGVFRRRCRLELLRLVQWRRSPRFLARPGY